MDEHIITAEHLTAFGRHLTARERSPGTVENYLRGGARLRRLAGRRAGGGSAAPGSGSAPCCAGATTPAPSTPVWPPSTPFSSSRAGGGWRPGR